VRQNGVLAGLGTTEGVKAVAASLVAAIESETGERFPAGQAAGLARLFEVLLIRAAVVRGAA
jgi:hypothetical protein